jgi:uncharacterized protein YuzE
MQIRYDKVSGAYYLKIREGRYSETIPLLEPGFGAGLDIDPDGYVLGVEFLSSEEMETFLERVGGTFDLPERVEDPANFHLANA